MSDGDPTGGASTGGGAADPNPDPNGGAGGAGAGESVSKEDYERVKRDMLKYKDERKTYQDQLAAVQADLEAIKTQRRQESEDYKGLAEDYKSKYESEREKRERLFNGLIRETKHRAALPELKKRGLLDNALVLLEQESFDDIDHELTDQGTILTHDVSSFADRFQKKYPFAFEKPKPPSVNNGGGGSSAVDGGNITIEKLTQLRNARGKSPEDKAKYLAALEKYNAQKLQA